MDTTLCKQRSRLSHLQCFKYLRPYPNTIFFFEVPLIAPGIANLALY